MNNYLYQNHWNYSTHTNRQYTFWVIDEYIKDCYKANYLGKYEKNN